MLEFLWDLGWVTNRFNIRILLLLYLLKLINNLQDFMKYIPVNYMTSFLPLFIQIYWLGILIILFSDQAVITKCYHLFCNPCIQRIVESRHRKCPVCSMSFGHNDVKPVYI